MPCYTWRFDGDDFVLERANRAAYERAEGALRALIGRRLRDIYPDRPDIAADLARALAERTDRPPRDELTASRPTASSADSTSATCSSRPTG